MKIISKPTHPASDVWLRSVFPEIEHVDIAQADRADVVFIHQTPEYDIAKERFPKSAKIVYLHTINLDTGNRMADVFAADPTVKAIVFQDIEQVYRWNAPPSPKVHVIPNAVDVSKYPKWTGGIEKPVAVCNMLPKRDPWCGHDIYNAVGVSCDLYGFGNETLPDAKGFLEHKQLLDVMAKHNVFFNQTRWSTKPNCVLDAMAIGMPIVSYLSPAVGSLLCGFGFISRDMAELRRAITALRQKPKIGLSAFGEAMRSRVAVLHHPERFKLAWKQVRMACGITS